MPNTAPYRKIKLIGGGFALVDADLFAWLSRWKWRAVKSNYRTYAVRRQIIDRQTITIRMHRLITHCPPGHVPHHENGNTLDNRRSNLTVMLDSDHAHLHGWR